MPDLPARVVGGADSAAGARDLVLADSIVRLAAALATLREPVHLDRPTVLALRPGPDYLDTAGTAGTVRQVHALAREWPALRAVAESAGYAAVERHAPGLVIERRTGRTFAPPVPAGKVGLVLLAPGAGAVVFDSVVPATVLRTALRRYLGRLVRRPPRA